MVDFTLLIKSCDVILDAEWVFRTEVLNALNEIAEEKGADILSFEGTIDDPRSTEGKKVTFTKVEIGETSVEFTTNEGTVYYINDLDPTDVIFLVGCVLNEGKPYEEEGE